MPRLRFALLLAALTILSAAPASAQLQPDATVMTKVTIPDIMAFLSHEGYTGAEVDEDGDVKFRIEGKTVYIRPGKSETSMSFLGAWGNTQATPEKVNSWNKTKRFSRAYLDHENDPVLELDLDFAGGVTVARVKDFFLTIRTSVDLFRAEVVN